MSVKGKEEVAANEGDEEIVLPIVIPLRFPIPAVGGDGEPLRELTVEKRLTAEAFTGIPASGILFDHMFKLVSKLTAQPISTIKKLDALDMYDAIEVLNRFLPNGLKTGGSQ
jgi:hypothetical protein